MATPTSKATFKSYCKRALGFGGIDINVSDDQVDDRVDEALQYFSQYHYDGVERMYLKYQITQDDIDRSVTNTTTTATDKLDSTITASFSEGKNFIPVTQTWPADLETPLSTWLKLSEKDSHGVFLESVEGGESLGRWSIVATKPLWEAVCHGKEIVKTWNNGITEIHHGDPFDLLKTWTNENKNFL